MDNLLAAKLNIQCSTNNIDESTSSQPDSTTSKPSLSNQGSSKPGSSKLGSFNSEYSDRNVSNSSPMNLTNITGSANLSGQKLSPQMEDARYTPSQEVDTNSQKRTNIEQRVTRSMSRNYQSTSLDLPNTHRISLNQTIFTLDMNLQFSFSDHDEITEHRNIIRIGEPGIYTLTKFHLNQCIFEFDYLPELNVFRPGNIDSGNYLINGVTTRSRSLSSSDGEIEPIEVIIRTLDNAVYTIIIINHDFIQLHKDLHKRFAISFRTPPVLNTYKDLYNYVKKYIIALKLTIPTVQNNPVVRSFVDMMHPTQFRIEQVSRSVYSPKMKPSVNTIARNNNYLLLDP